MILIFLCGLLILIILIIVFWIAYNISSAFQQSIVVTVPLNNTYRYVPSFNLIHKYKIDKIKVCVTGSIKKKEQKNKHISKSTITPVSKVKELIDETIIQPYSNCLLIHESNTFIIDDEILQTDNCKLKKCPIIKDPTVENLSTIFFNKLSPLFPKIGAKLLTIKLFSGDIQVNHSRYKISDYQVKK